MALNHGEMSDVRDSLADRRQKDHGGGILYPPVGFVLERYIRKFSTGFSGTEEGGDFREDFSKSFCN